MISVISKKITLIIIFSLVFLSIFIRPLFAQENLQFIERIVLTQNSEGGGARPEIVFYDNSFYVIYLAGVVANTNKPLTSFKVKIISRDFKKILNELTIRKSNPQNYEFTTDIRVTAYKDTVFILYETTHPKKGARLWAEMRKLDENFTKVAQSPNPIAQGKFWFSTQEGDELLDDPIPLVFNDRFFAITRLKNAPFPDQSPVYRVRELSFDLSKVISTFDLDLSEAVAGGAGVCSFFVKEKRIYAVLPTVIIPLALPSTRARANYDLVLVCLNDNFTFNPGNDVKTLFFSQDKVEHMPTGVRIKNNNFYLAHPEVIKEYTKPPEPGGEPPQRIWLRVFDIDFDELDTFEVSQINQEFGSHPTVEVIGDKIYVAYGSNKNIFVYVFQFAK